jgi:uncharacterized membrane protein
VIDLELESCRFAGLLLVFFFTSSRVTRIGEARKRALDPEFKEGGQRNWCVRSLSLFIQSLCQ